jgi:hypothetical protein
MIGAILLAAALETAHGTWNIIAGRTQAVLETRWHSDDFRHDEENGRSIDPKSLGIVDALNSTGEHSTFTIHRDAGDLVFDGWFGNGEAAGNFVYTPNAAFFTSLEKRGYAIDGIHDELSFATMDVTNDYIDSIERLGYKTDTRGLLQLRALGVTPAYITEMRAAGVDVQDARRLGQMKAVGVTPSFISDIAKAGYPHLTPREYVQLKAVGVDAAYIKYLSDHGLKNLNVRRIVEMKAMGIQ